MASLAEFVECLDCGFVTYSEDSSTPKPKRRAACPNCSSTAFEFTDR